MKGIQFHFLDFPRNSRSILDKNIPGRFFQIRRREGPELKRVYCGVNVGLRTPPSIAKKHLLVQSRVERTAFSDQNSFFLIEYISNFFRMNENYVLLYQVLDELSFLNLQFNFTSRLHRANYLSLSFKKGDTKRFL